MMHLEPCPHCHRHVKVSETSCPFCTGPLADAFAHVPSRIAPRSRLGRAATFAFGLVAMSQGACSDDDPPPVDAVSAPSDAGADAAQDADFDGGDVPIYAAAPTRDGGTPTSRG